MIHELNLIGLYVNDPLLSADFYESLGFGVLRQGAEIAEVTLGSMKVDLIAISTAEKSGEKFVKEAAITPKGGGVYFNIETTDIDNFYKSLLEKGLQPSTQPRDWPWGRREFVLRDPDEYKLVFYEKIR